MRRLRKNLSPSMVVACIALLVALGGVATAALRLPANSVGRVQLRANAVNSAKVANGSLQAIDFRPSQLPAGPAGPKGDKGAKGDPGVRGAPGAIGPSNGYVDSSAGPITVQTSETRIATLRIPAAGSYVLWSKVWIVRTTAGQPTQQTCFLRANDGSQDLTFSTAVTALPEQMVNVLAREFTEPVTANLFCSASGQSQAYDAKIAAIRVGSLTTSTG